MKPCAQNRKPLALLAIGALEGQEERGLRAHLEDCAGCRDYLAQMERVTDRLRMAEPTAGPEPSLYLHRRVRQKLHERPRKQIFQWRLAASAAAVAAVLLLTRQGAQHPPVVPTPARPAAGDFDVTVLNYQMLANQSLDKLDRTLTEQGDRNPPPMPVYRAGSLAVDQSGI